MDYVYPERVKVTSKEEKKGVVIDGVPGPVLDVDNEIPHATETAKTSVLPTEVESIETRPTPSSKVSGHPFDATSTIKDRAQQKSNKVPATACTPAEENTKKKLLSPEEPNQRTSPIISSLTPQGTRRGYDRVGETSRFKN
ncbi:hypothetical protein RF11_08614 [Thelohanellus kitauei]|uniref:Uncharacterized protein n=1 Tax=Thelohanellus kitauei TaxID=669202 RepID=A0A0C2MK90_THEKT|nr:hypothetical protein RF11_08614 [Thelohanellus kitauei]